MHFVHDFVPADADDITYQSDHMPLKVDTVEYPFTVYHLTFASLGPSILNGLDVSCRNYCPGVSFPTGLKVRSTSFSTNLISPVEQPPVPDDEKLPLPALNWQF